MKEKLKEQKLFFISILFIMLFSFPFIKMANTYFFILGIPQLYFYIFLVWLLSIVLIFFVVDTRKKSIKQKTDE